MPVTRSVHPGDRHSRRVGRLRFLLPVTALSLLAVVIAWPWLTGGAQGLIVPVFRHAIDQDGDAMRMASPRYVGRTKASESYEVTASSAFLDPTEPDRIHLDQLRAILELTDRGAVHLRADEGVYFRGKDRLELDGALELIFAGDYRFTTASAEVDLERGHVAGSGRVHGEGPVGALVADRFDIENGGQVLRFEGRVQVTMTPGGPET